MWGKGILGREEGRAGARALRQRWQYAHKSSGAPLTLEWQGMRMAGDEIGGSGGRKGVVLDLVGYCNDLRFYSK